MIISPQLNNETHFSGVEYIKIIYKVYNTIPSSTLNLSNKKWKLV